MMNRLVVFETDKGHFAVRPMEWAGIWKDDGKIQECGLRHTAIFATKEDAEWYANMKNAEEQGLLLRLPCKVGDTVFTLHKNIVKEEKVYDVQYRGIKYQQGQRWFMNIGATVYFEMDFGKTVFLTQAEAEQKLKEMESDSDG